MMDDLELLGAATGQTSQAHWRVITMGPHDFGKPADLEPIGVAMWIPTQGWFSCAFWREDLDHHRDRDRTYQEARHEVREELRRAWLSTPLQYRWEGPGGQGCQIRAEAARYCNVRSVRHARIMMLAKFRELGLDDTA